MSIMCKSCGKFIMSVFKETCDDCVREERLSIARYARNEKALRDRRWQEAQRDRNPIDNSIVAITTTSILDDDEPVSSSRYTSSVSTSSYSSSDSSSYSSYSSSDSSSYSSSSCDSSSSSSCGGD